MVKVTTFVYRHACGWEVSDSDLWLKSIPMQFQLLHAIFILQNPQVITPSADGHANSF